MSCVFRVDASFKIGTGHVMRCLALANALKRRGAEIAFICREHPGNLLGFVESAGFKALRLPGPEPASISGSLRHSDWLGVSQETDARETLRLLKGGDRAEWMIVDHYALDATWESAIRSEVRRILVIDDLADRRHDCDTLLDHSDWHGAERRYSTLVPSHCKLLLGTRYLLFREEVVRAARNASRRRDAVKRILVFIGGADPSNVTDLVLAGCSEAVSAGIAVTAVIGSSNPHRDELEARWSNRAGVTIMIQPGDYVSLIQDHDLGIGAGGTSAWERVAFRLPTLTLWFAENQRLLVARLEELGCVESLGDASGLLPDKVAKSIERLRLEKRRLTGMQQACEAVLPAGVLGAGMDELVGAMMSSSNRSDRN